MALNRFMIEFDDGLKDYIYNLDSYTELLVGSPVRIRTFSP